MLHGVCGACTVLIAGAPARSCITYAVACDGLAIRTIEGFDDDATMADLREAFSREHALQCGFCTPGMLISARDIAERIPDADERRIRVELSGNLCRCTGYRGIVNAVRSVVEASRQQPAVSVPKAGAALAAPLATFVPKDDEASPAAAAAFTTAADEPRQGWTRFEESFVILQSPSAVWNTFEDIPAVTACLPGATLTEYDAHTVKGKMSVKLGPISASFAGSAGIERDDAALRGVIRGRRQRPWHGLAHQRRSCLSPSAGGRRPPNTGHPVGRIQPARRARAVLALRDCAGPRPPPGCRFCRQSQYLPHGEITRSTVEHPTQCRTFAAPMGPRSVGALDWV